MNTRKLDSLKKPKNDNERAYSAALRMLARRDHSETEIRKKLKLNFDINAIDLAVARLKKMQFLKEPEVLAEMWAQATSRRGRGRHRIAQELKKRGLPLVEIDPENEYSACHEVFSRKFGSLKTLPVKDRAKAFRYLTYRGFDTETVKRVLYEKF